MDFIRRLVGSKPKRKAPPAREDVSLNRSVDDATVYRPIPKLDSDLASAGPDDARALSESASRGRPDQLTMMGTSPLEATPPTGDTATQPQAPLPGVPDVVLDEGSEAATVYMQIPPEPEPEITQEPPPRRQIATLSAVEGELAGQVFALLEGENQIGRAPDSDVVLSSRFVSRVHARIVCSDGKVTFVPVSDQLTLVDGTAAAEQDLQDGAEIQLGRTKLQLRIEG